jgi:molecular chaperone GrpE
MVTEEHMTENESGTSPDVLEEAVQLSPEVEALLRAAELEDQLKRLLADMQNLRKRTEKEKDDIRRYAIAGFAEDMVNVCENLFRAMAATPREATQGNAFMETLYTGLEMTQMEMLSVFKQHGIERIEPLGELFNHEYHQAIVQTESAEHKAGTVLKVIHAGYKLKDRLIRPALVEVAKMPASDSLPVEADSPEAA